MIGWLRGVLCSAVLSLGLVGCGHHEGGRYVAPVFLPNLEMAADTQAHAAMPDGQRLPQVLLGVSYLRGGVSDWSIPLRAGQCYAFGYATDEDVGKVSFYIWDPENRRVESARGRPGEGVATFCPRVNGIHRLEAKSRQGGGHVVVVGYVSPMPGVTIWVGQG